MRNFKGQRVAILGLSTEGCDSVKFFLKEDAQITCCDRRLPRALGETYSSLARLPVSFRLGENYLADLESYDLLVRTPGMSPRLPELVEAKKRGKEITTLTKLFFALCPAPVVGVTGTKGKGTTSSLIYEMLKASGQKVYLGGNIGTPLLSQVRQIKPHEVAILELSSFQLEDLSQSPHVAVVLRTTQEHLANFDPLATNFHPSRESYVEAKKSIVRFQKSGDFAVLNADDPTSSSFAAETRAQVYYFSRSSSQADAYVDQAAVYLKWDRQTTRIAEASEIKLRGMHNLENIAAAALATKIMGGKLAAIGKVARTFLGLPHRIEFVRKVNNISFYDDSFSTVPETTIAAVRSFSEPLILILGGSEKGSDFSEMGRVIAQSSVRVAIIIGMMTSRIKTALGAAGFKGKVITGCRSMPEVVAVARKIAQSGDVVLLSPACASFDMFQNYKDRGDQFKYEVNSL
ncbi:MAG: UDP-N-acetylmuramoyl-L-alanine--D-glutamate ligase [Patescibacteria group bacterium]